MSTTLPEILALVCFFAALVHSLNGSRFERLAYRQKPNSRAFHLFHHLSEIEVVFGLYALIYGFALFIAIGPALTLAWIGERNFSEALFIVIVMITASTDPILNLASRGIEGFSKLLPFSSRVSHYASVLVLGPLFGSLITEPAAMTVSALLLHRLLPAQHSKRLFYSTLAALFVNVSIGGVLTSFAAPPVLMVARPWQWDSLYLFTHFGWKAVLAVVLNTVFVVQVNAKELNSAHAFHSKEPRHSPLLLTAINFAFLAISVLLAHHPLALMGGFLGFLSYLKITRKHQGALKVQSAFWVGVFLAALVVLTAEQGWWVKPILESLQDFALYLSTIGLTAITDNAAITSLATTAPNLSDSAKYSVLAGAVVGGGLTLIANAPNPAGFSILKSRAGESGFSPLQLFLWALPITLFTGALLWIH